MRPAEISRDFLPIAKFKARASEVINRVRTERRPTVITLNGEPAAVLISPRDYDRLMYEDRVRDAITQGLDDEREGRLLSTEEIRRRADQRFGKLAKKARK